MNREDGLPGWLIGCFAFSIAGAAVADVTLEINVGPIDAPAGTVGILVADREGDGFIEMRGIGGFGTRLSVGETFGNSDDIIVAVIQADSGFHWNGSTGFGDLASEIDYESLGVEAGDDLNLYWFEDRQQPGEILQHGDAFRSFRSNSVSNSGGSIGFALPPDGEVCSIAHLSSAVGGDSDPMRSGGGRVVRTGEVGSNVFDLNSGGPLTRLLAPNEVELFFIDIRSAGGIRVTASGMEGLIPKLYRADGTDISGATQSVGDATNVVGGVVPGRYFVTVEGESRAVAGLYEIETTSGKLRPDLTIQKPGSRRFLGVKRYNLSGGGQTAIGKTSGGRKVSFGTEGVNRGNLTDSFVYTGSRSNRYFVVRFFRIKPGRKNVTAGVRKGYDVADVKRNDRVSIAMEVDPKTRGKPKGPAKRFKGSVQLKSGNLSTIRDRVRATLIAQ